MPSSHMLPPLSGKRVKAGQRKAPAQVLPSMPFFSLGSPNTNLPYLVTMETGAACQPHPTDTCSLPESVQESFSQRLQSSPDQAPGEGDPFFDLTLEERSGAQKDVPTRYLLFPVSGKPGKQSCQYSSILPKASPESRYQALCAQRCFWSLSGSPVDSDTAHGGPCCHQRALVQGCKAWLVPAHRDTLRASVKG